MSFSLVIVGINVIVISLTIGDSSASVYDIEERLQQHLFSNYSKHVRPTENGESIVLDVTFYLLMLLDVDEKLQIMKTRGWTEQRWRDGRLVWDPDDFGGISRTIVPTDWLWMPTVANLRSANDRYYMAETKSVGVYYNGTVRNIPQDVMETPCTLDIRQFPFDKQRCTISFVPWNLLQHELTIRAKPEKAILWYLLQNTEWDVVGSSSSKQFAYSDIDDSNWTAVDFTLHLKRKPLYYIVNIISPSIVLGVLTLLVFFLPCDAGEKLSFSVSILIATSLYSVIVSDIMPVTSESVPLSFSFFTSTQASLQCPLVSASLC
ncbi:neuronal acetylcholine receptor subunit beta-2-like [Ptychodera flava]|uniref:neuronal acetylcholine receptor subunit beta-2-like n=1 Tax=Ptychodera flava TaxID=63121 RepID=UPI00396A8FA6